MRFAQTTLALDGGPMGLVRPVRIWVGGRQREADLRLSSGERDVMDDPVGGGNT